MRIDYFIVSEQLKERIVACEIHGHGIEMEGNIDLHSKWHLYSTSDPEYVLCFSYLFLFWQSH